MKVKYRQLYCNDCGINSIRNLLFLYDKKNISINLEYTSEGTSMNNMQNCLKQYFYKVDCISFDINQLKKVKNFEPFIGLLKKDKNSHYVVIYKKNKKYLYVLDSLALFSYKVSYKNFEKVFAKKAIIPSEYKSSTLNKKITVKSIFIMFLSIVESLLLLSSTIILQQIIDNGYKDALLYIIIQVFLLLITTYKMSSFLSIFKTIDTDIVYKTCKGIFNLNKTYIKQYNIDEVSFRTYDAYTYKSMILTFTFNVVSDFVMAILTYILMFSYSKILSLITLIIIIVAVFISIIIFKKSRIITEKRRVSEYDFLNTYRDSFSKKNYKENEEEALNKLLVFQLDDYKFQKLNMSKNLIFCYFQSLIICIMVCLYFTSLYEKLSIGSLIALINLVSLILQPVLNICSEMSTFSNFSLIKNRIDDIHKNAK